MGEELLDNHEVPRSILFGFSLRLASTKVVEATGQISQFGYPTIGWPPIQNENYTALLIDCRC